MRVFVLCQTGRNRRVNGLHVGLQDFLTDPLFLLEPELWIHQSQLTLAPPQSSQRATWCVWTAAHLQKARPPTVSHFSSYKLGDEGVKLAFLRDSTYMCSCLKENKSGRDFLCKSRCNMGQGGDLWHIYCTCSSQLRNKTHDPFQNSQIEWQELFISDCNTTY